MINAEQPKAESIVNQGSYLENIFHALPYLLLLIDEQGNCIDTPQANLSCFSDNPDFYIGKNLSKIFCQELMVKFKETKSTINEKTNYATIEFSKNINNQEIWLSSTLTIVEPDQYLMIIQDITLWKQKCLELQKAKNLAEATNQSKTNFIASVSHELRTPLNAIQGYTQILELDNSLTEKQRNFLKTIKNSGDHLLNLINEILDISRIEAQREKLQLKEFNLYALIHEVLSTVQIKAKSKGLMLKFIETTPLSNMVKGDQKKIKQILYNLLINSVKFTEHGDIVLRVSSTEIISSENREFPNNHKCFIRLEVEDSGVGIPEDKIEKIFEPFTHEDIKGQSVEGIGLGLPITKKLLDLMDGNISVKSELGKGSIFTVEFELELVKEKSQHSLKKKFQHQSIQGNSKKILIADDNEDNLLMLSSFLESFGFKIFIAKNGQQTVDLAKQEMPQLILLDFLMPDMDGLQVLVNLKDSPQLNSTKVIGITAAVTDKPNVGEFASKCDSFISKPIDLNHLLEEIKKVITILENKNYHHHQQEITPSHQVIKYTIPPLPEIIHIKELVDQGDYIELEKVINQLSKQSNYQKFGDKVNDLIKSYDEYGILNYLESLADRNE
ncbi:MAG: ATP-binding response regulator [bacterium]